MNMALSQKPKFRNLTDEKIKRLTTQDFEDLRDDALACASANNVVWKAYWTKASAIKAAIESLFPTEKSWRKKRPTEHKLLKYADRILLEESPNGIFLEIRYYDEWALKVHESRRMEHAQKQHENLQKAEVRKHLSHDAKAIRYGALRGWMDVEDVETFMEKAEETDKYLNLALAMEATRNDWSEGFYRVKSALSVFKIETEQDQEIYDDVKSCMYSEDGRVFRDTRWNYSRLFELADQPLLKQVDELRAAE